MVGGHDDKALAEAIEVMSQALTVDAKLRLFLAGPGGPHSEMGPGGPDGVARAVRAYFAAHGYVGTQHSVGNVRVAFTGEDSARSTSRIPCFHWLADHRMMLAPVNYEDTLVRQDGVWKIVTRDVFAVRFWVAEGYAPDPLDPTLLRQ